MLFRAKGDYESALPYYFRALNLGKRLFSSDHPDLFYPLAGIAITYERMEDLQSALAYFKRTYSLRAEPFVAVRGNLRMAIIHARMGDFDQAMPLFERSWKVITEDPQMFADWVQGLSGYANNPSERIKSLEVVPELLQRMGLAEEAREMESGCILRPSERMRPAIPRAHPCARIQIGSDLVQ